MRGRFHPRTKRRWIQPRHAYIQSLSWTIRICGHSANSGHDSNTGMTLAIGHPRLSLCSNRLSPCKVFLSNVKIKRGRLGGSIARYPPSMASPAVAWLKAGAPTARGHPPGLATESLTGRSASGSKGRVPRENTRPAHHPDALTKKPRTRDTWLCLTTSADQWRRGR